MTEPKHYSRDVAQRCSRLIRNLRPMVQAGFPDDEEFGGPLGTTFLLAMATPMILLPIERLFKPGAAGAIQAGDDRRLDPELAREVADVLGPGRTFGATRFAAPGRWSYVTEYHYFNVADDWPDDLLGYLGMPQAFESAEGALAERVLRDLRNALAHGGVAYLDADGRQTEGNAAMLAFASVRTGRTGRSPSLNILRVSEDDFCSFLMAWADWLAQRPIREALDRLDPLAA